MTKTKMAATIKGNDHTSHNSSTNKSGGRQEFIHVLTDGTKNSIYPAPRDAWALDQLIQAGETGCTTIDNPGPRWSAYRWNLVHEHGLNIQTKHESHGGAFPGNHARYILKSKVIKVTKREAA